MFAIFLNTVSCISIAIQKSMRSFHFQLCEISKEISVRHEWSRITCGRDLDLTSPDLHPRVAWLVRREGQLAAQIDDLSQDVAVRPHPPQVRVAAIRHIHVNEK